MARDGAAREQHGVTVRRRLGDAARAGHAAGAGHVLDHHLLAEDLGEPRRHDAADRVDRTAGRIGNDERHRPDRPILGGGRRGRRERDGGSACRNGGSGEDRAQRSAHGGLRRCGMKRNGNSRNSPACSRNRAGRHHRLVPIGAKIRSGRDPMVRDASLRDAPHHEDRGGKTSS